MDKADAYNAHIQNYEIGERVAQLIIIPYPTIELEEVTELNLTDRGQGGFGSTN
jgi:dUTP pyrophosphatase